VDEDGFGGEVDADSDIVLLAELSVDVFVDEGGLADACIAMLIPESPINITLKLRPFSILLLILLN
jgi:hypothetical protein